MTNPIVLVPYMSNIDSRIVHAQRMVFDALASDIPFYQLITDKPHATTCDLLTKEAFDAGHDVVVWFDVDAIPLTREALLMMIKRAWKGWLTGNVQRSNHIQNNEHLYIAPSCMAFSRETYDLIGRPSFEPTPRGDVGEELTYKAKEAGINVFAYVPLWYENLPAEGHEWPTANGLRPFGLNTFFGTIEDEKELPMTFHSFQSRMSSQVERFVEICNQTINDDASY